MKDRMIDDNNTRYIKDNSKAFQSSSNDKENLITNLELLLAVFVLKYYSSKEKPLSSSNITDQMSLITGHSHVEKTILRKLRNEYLYTSEDNTISSIVSLIFGGHIVMIGVSKERSIKKHCRFYFVPFLSSSHFAMICSSITSNRYLSKEEIDYLIGCERCLSPYNISTTTAETTTGINPAFDSHSLPKLPHKPTNSLKSENLKILQNVNELYEAINADCQVNLTYGSYNTDENNLRKLRFYKKQKAYIINPYFMLWNNGHYYLVATHKGHKNPVHFRISRIASITVVKEPEDARKSVPREALPDCLSDYIYKRHNGQNTFNTTKYSSTYPLMGIYNDSKLIDCVLECTPGTLSILVDTFGHNIPIAPSNILHSPNEVDIHGNPQRFLVVNIMKVQFDNILMFCLQQHEAITAIHPPELVNAIFTRLSASVNKYSGVVNNPPQHPFRTTI